jgi:hypothetical protein
VNTSDPTLQAAAEAFYGVQFPTYIDGTGEVTEACRPAEFFTAAELEQLLTVVREAIAAPVLALHAPLGGTSTCGECYDDPWPCPTVRALGVAA